MHAVYFAEHGGPDVLRHGDRPDPATPPGRVKIAVRAASVNVFDCKLRSGRVRATALPVIPGLDAAGVVVELGAGVGGVSIGDEVFGPTAGGSYAEYAVLTAWAGKPAGMSWAQAAAVPVVAETAARGLDAIGAGAGSTIVINGASGGVGTAAVQLALERGVRVIGVAGPANAEYLTSLGAVPVAYGDGMSGRVRAAAPDGVDAAFDVAGSGVIPELIGLTGDPARVVSIADFSASEYGAQVSGGEGRRSWSVLPVVADLFGRDRYRIEVQEVFPLAEAARAHEVMERGSVRGKLVLSVP